MAFHGPGGGGRWVGGPVAMAGPPMSMRPAPPRALGRSLLYLRIYWRSALAAIVGLMGAGATTLMSPQLIRIAVDGGIGLGKPEVVLAATGGLLVMALLRGVFSFLQGYGSERASQGVAYQLRDALFAHIQRLSFSYYDQAQTGQLMTRVTSDVEQVRLFSGQALVQLVSALVLLVGTLAILLATNAGLTLVAILPLPFIAAIMFRFMSTIAPRFGRIQQLVGQLNSLLQENIAGVKVVRAFAREFDEERRYNREAERLLDQSLAVNRAFASNFPLVFTLSSMSTLLVVWVGGVEVINGFASAGQLLAFNAYLGFLLFPIMALGFLTVGLARAEASAKRIFDVLDAPIDVADKPDAIHLPLEEGRVVFENVTFNYPGDERPAVVDLSFVAEPGQTIAILGATGSGKSTVVSLIPRFYDVTAGRVTIDGYDVRDVTLASLRGQIGIVLQDSRLVRGSIRDNIAFGRPDASDEEVVAAATAAQAAEFIDDLPQGYLTLLGDGGQGLSGGQRQRIAIARALLVRPRILILDDSTSAVDAATEQKIQQALDSLIADENSTVFVIAQRISTVRMADKVLLMDRGKAVALGTHQELLETSALYNEILGSQLRRDRRPVSSPEVRQ